MSSVDVYETALRLMERYGFGIVLATATLWFVRVDVVLPMVEAHKSFLQEMAATQRGIASSIREQTRLLYVLLDDRERMYTTSALDADELPKN